MTIVFTTSSLTAQTGGREDKTYVVEDVQIYTFDELDYAFYQAYNSFLVGNDGMSGARIKRAAYFVRLESENAKAHNKKPIVKQAEHLEMFADSVALGRINSAWRLRRAFAQTHNVLANDYKVRAAAFWTADKAQDAGHAMATSAGYLGHAAKWVGVKIEGGAMATGKAVGSAGKAVGKGTVKTTKAVGSGITKAGKAVGSGATKAGKAIGKGTTKAAKSVGIGTTKAASAVGKGTVKATKAAGKGIATAGVESYRGVRWLSGKMIKGIGFVPEKVGQGLEWLGDGIEKVGAKVEPEPKIKKVKE